MTELAEAEAAEPVGGGASAGRSLGGHRSKRLRFRKLLSGSRAKCRVRGRGDRLVACPRDLACIPAAWHSRAVPGEAHTTIRWNPQCKVLYNRNSARSPITLITIEPNSQPALGGLARAALQPNRSCQPSHAHGPCHRRCIISHCTRLEGRGYERFARVPSCSSARSSAPASFSTRMIVKYPRMHASM